MRTYIYRVDHFTRHLCCLLKLSLFVSASSPLSSSCIYEILQMKCDSGVTHCICLLRFHMSTSGFLFDRFGLVQKKKLHFNDSGHQQYRVLTEKVNAYTVAFITGNIQIARFSFNSILFWACIVLANGGIYMNKRFRRCFTVSAFFCAIKLHRLLALFALNIIKS